MKRKAGVPKSEGMVLRSRVNSQRDGRKEATQEGTERKKVWDAKRKGRMDGLVKKRK